MKRFLASLATISLFQTIGRHPAIAGILMLLGVGGGATAIAILTPPTIVPFSSSNFNPNQAIGTTNNGLKPNGGTNGALELPIGPSTGATGSFGLYFEAQVDPALAYSNGASQTPFTGLTLLTNTSSGQPAFIYQRLVAGATGTQWWETPHVGGTQNLNAAAGSNYITGFYPFSATGGGCAREPTGVLQGGSAPVEIVDPGFGCSTAPVFNAATVPKLGSQQTGIPATCAASAVSGQMLVTTSLPVSPGLSPGLTYSLTGFTTSGGTSINTAFTATSVTGTGPYSVVGTATGMCPTISSTGTLVGGTGAAFTFPTLSSTNPFSLGGTGITTKNGQHICGIIGEYGDDSPFPGAQFLEMVDDKGVALPGSPALVQTPNMGTANFTGYTTVGSATLTVTAMNAYTGSSSWAAYSSGTGLVTFSLSTNPGFVPGSQFTVSGMTPSGFNQTYVATAVSNGGLTVVGNPLSGPGGIPQANNPGASTGSGGSLISVIFPGMTVLGSTPVNSFILPYGTAATTGTGSNASFPVTYQLSATQTTPIGSSGSPATIFAWSSFYYSAATNGNPAGGVATVRSQSTVGDFTGLIGSSAASVAGSIKTGWGGALGNFATLWGIIPNQTGGAPSATDLASICTKQTDVQTYAATKGLKVNSLYRLNDLGIWGDSGNGTITGYITNSTGTNATLNVVSMPFGGLTLPTGSANETAYLTGVGLPVASPVTIGLSTTTTSSTPFAITPNTTAALGSSGSPVTFAVGAFKPALPVQSNTLLGYIDTTAGVSTLHVTSLDDGVTHSGFARFTGTLGTSFTASIASGTNQLVVTSPVISSPNTGLNAVIGLGMTVNIPGGTPSTAHIQSMGTALGASGTYTLDATVTGAATAEVMFGSGQLPGPATTLQATGITGTLQAGMAVTDGGASLTGSPLLITGGSGSVWTVAGNYYAPINADATMIASLTTLVPGEYIQNSTAAAPITNPVKVVAFQRLTNACNAAITGAYNGGPGCYTLSGSPNSSGAVGSSGTLATIFGTTITDGGAIAPGPALTIKDQGPFITFPLTNFSMNVGTLTLSGTYDTGALGGTPSGIQALVSNTANGPALAGCTPCNWGALTGTISSGSWSGTLAGVPGGGPYFISVRAANGTAYATLPNSVRVGLVYALYGQGQADSIQGAQSGSYISYFSGLWGSGGWAGAFAGLEHYLLGPPVLGNFVPAQTEGYAGDRFGVTSTAPPVSEAFGAFDQELANAFGVPASFLSPTRDGVGIGINTLGNVTQTQTIGAGNGATLTWCSAAKFCPTAGVSPAGPLLFDAASLTGAWFSGASISGTTFSAGTRVGGALEPGMVLNTPNAPTLVMCLTNCSSAMSFSSSTWLLSATDTGTPTRADPPPSMTPFGTATPWPNFNIQEAGTSVYGFAGYGWPLVKAGTFTVKVNGTVVCQDSQTFAYNQTGGNCTGAGVSGFVNYQTGDYQINFSVPPASNAVIIASWTNIISPETVATTYNRPQGIDFFGDGTCQSGPDSAMFCKAPGGVNGHIFSGEGTDKGYMLNQNAPSNVGYPYGGIGYSQMISWLYGTKFPNTIPGASAGVSFITTGQWRIEGPQAFSQPGVFLDGVHDQWTQDVVTESLFSGTVASGALTLSANAFGPMWEGEIVGCAPVTTNCTIGPLSGVYITGLTSGAWGAAGSTYSLAGSPPAVTVASAMQNPVYYSGSGPAFYAGTLNDIDVQQTSGLAGTTGRSPHTEHGFTGGRRATSRWAAMIYGANGGNATDPKVDRVKADATGCDAAALAAPCFDIGTGSGTHYAASATATWSGNTVTISGGLTAHARPFVVGQAVSCASCNSNLVITSLSVPPTQSTASGAGEVGQTFTFTANNAAGQAIGGSGSGTITGACSGTSGTGSSCIDIAISTNVSGTFGTAAALATCGANNLNGNAPNYIVPNGVCSDNGVGELIRAFRIGTNQAMYGTAAGNPTAGSVFDDGVDIASGFFTQSSAFTCNIVAAKVVQCVKGPAYSGGVITAVGQWSSGATYISYGDLTIVSGRIASLLGYVGGQSFPFTGGSGYTNGTQTITATCPTVASRDMLPRFDVTVTGGAIVDVVPSAAMSGNPPAGLGIGGACTLSLSALGGGSGGAIASIPLAPLEGQGGIGTYNTDSNTMGMFLYDNSGFLGNPLNSFFTNGQGGYFEPGLPVRPFGLFQGEVVSG